MQRLPIDLSYAALLASLAGLPIFFSSGGLDSLRLLFLSIAACTGGAAVASCYLSWRKFTQRPAFPAALGAILSVLVSASVPAFQWPLLLAYRLSQGPLDHLAARLQAGEPVSVPRVAGRFTIEKAELSRDGIPCLWTNPDPSGRTGFIQTPPHHVPFNLASMIHLDQRWQYISED